MKREFIPMSGLYDMNIGALRMYYAQRPTPKPENEVKNVVFRCDVVKDKDILEALKDVKNKSDYIKSLLRRALQEENAEKERTEKEELSCAAESARRRRQRSNFRLAVFCMEKSKPRWYSTRLLFSGTRLRGKILFGKIRKLVQRFLD